VSLALIGCSGRDDLDGRRVPVPGLPKRGPAYALDYGARTVAYDLHNNRAAAAVFLDGALHIDCGTADFAKYAEGAYRSPWHLGQRVDGVRAALVDGLAGELYFPLDDAPGGVQRDRQGGISIWLLARAARPNQLVSVFVNEHALRDIAMPGPDWDWHGIKVPAGLLIRGENKLRFYFRHAGEIVGVRTASAVARIVVGGAAPPAADARLLSEEISLPTGHLAALSAPRPSRLSYYLALPARQPALAFAAASTGRSAIRVQLNGEVLWEGAAAEDWQTKVIELGGFGGQLVRLDLLADGPVHWGRPSILEEGAAQTASPAAPATLADHVIVWTVSSLRADRVDNPEVPTPNFSRLAGEGIYFRRAVAAAPAPGPAHVAFMTGRYASSDVVPAGASTLGERFRAAGYTTVLVSGNGFVNDEVGFARGFNHYMNPMRRRRPHSARVLWQLARRSLTEHKDSRTLLYIATSEPHLPYTPSERARRNLWKGPSPGIDPAHSAVVSSNVRNGKRSVGAEQRAYLRALYDAEVQDADRAFGNMLNDLKKLGIADRTAVVLVGDHGEELWERGNLGHGASLYREVLEVPLIIWFPRGLPARVVDEPVEAADVYPSVLELAGIAPNAEAQGLSLLPLARGADRAHAVALANLPGRARAVVAGRYKLIVPRAGPHELYDLTDDPGELSNQMGSLPVVERFLRTVFGLRVAYENAWQRRRWGAPNGALLPAFAEDHGI
jgi:choline-sulfatase